MGVGVTAENVLKYVNVKVGTGLLEESYQVRQRCGVTGMLECICCACDVHMPTVLDLSTRDINTIIFQELFRYCANAHPQFAGIYPTLYRFRSKNLDHLV